MPHKFHRTITWAWLLLLDDAMGTSPDRDFDALLAEHPHLGSREALFTLYRPEVLEADVARAHFVVPERR